MKKLFRSTFTLRCLAARLLRAIAHRVEPRLARRLRIAPL